MSFIPYLPLSNNPLNITPSRPSVQGSTDLEHIQIIKKVGGKLTDSYLDEGMLLVSVFDLCLAYEGLCLALGEATFENRATLWRHTSFATRRFLNRHQSLFPDINLLDSSFFCRLYSR